MIIELIPLKPKSNESMRLKDNFSQSDMIELCSCSDGFDNIIVLVCFN